MKFVLLFVCMLGLLGCASKGFNRGELRKQIGVVQPQVTDQQIKEALERKANLPKPFKLALYFKDPARQAWVSSSWRWTEPDRDLITQVTKQLKEDGLVSEVIPIAGSVVQEEDLKSLRLAAAKHGADALLIISGVSDVDRYINKLGWFYLFLLPAFFIPGSEVDTLFLSSASMWDVRNEFLYLTAEAEETQHETYIAAFGARDEELSEDAKTASLKKLQGQIVEMVKGTKN